VQRHHGRRSGCDRLCRGEACGVLLEPLDAEQLFPDRGLVGPRRRPGRACKRPTEDRVQPRGVSGHRPGAEGIVNSSLRAPSPSLASSFPCCCAVVPWPWSSPAFSQSGNEVGGEQARCSALHRAEYCAIDREAIELAIDPADMGEDRATVKHAERFLGRGPPGAARPKVVDSVNAAGPALPAPRPGRMRTGSTPHLGEQELGDGGGIHFRCRGHPLVRLAG